MVANDRRRFVVLGAGTIGRVVVRDLFESNSDNQILVADYNEPAAKALADSFKDSRVKSAFADARKPEELAHYLLKNRYVVLNCLQHDFNLSVMKAALLARVHYLDLGGLFYWTRRQWKLHEEFFKAGLTAVIGMGCAPGITNLLAAYLIEKLGKARSIKIRVGSIDLDSHEGEFYFPYSVQTILEELTLKPYLFKDRKLIQTRPHADWELTEFPKPLGQVWTLRTRHSEIATLPVNFREKGLSYCDFRVSFDRDFVREILRLRKKGWTLAKFRKFTALPTEPNDYEISRVIVDNATIDCHAKAKPEWKASAGDIDTACPISIAAQMIADGLIYKHGVLPPETAVPIKLFFNELEKRGMKIEIQPVF